MSEQETKIQVMKKPEVVPSTNSFNATKAHGGRPDPLGNLVKEMFDAIHSMEMKGDITRDQSTTFANMLFFCNDWGLGEIANLVYLRLRTSVSIGRGGRTEGTKLAEAAAKVAEANKQFEMRI